MVKQLLSIMPPIIKKPLYSLKNYLQQGKVIYQSHTPYSLLQVIDKKGIRYLVFKDPNEPLHLQKPELIYQSYMNLNDPVKTSIPYADYFHFAWIFNPTIKSVLMIGLGAGTVAKRFLRDYPHIRFTTVEIDSEVVEVAHRFFSLEPTSRHHIVVDDGRNYLQNSSELSDLILMDAFYARTIPHSLFTKEFFTQAKSCLSEKGILSINFNGALAGSKSALFKSIYQTLTLVFPKIYLFTSKKDAPEAMQNIVFFALVEDQQLSSDDILIKARNLAKSKITIAGFVEKAHSLYPYPIETQDAPVLSDACAPPGGVLDLYDYPN